MENAVTPRFAQPMKLVPIPASIELIGLMVSLWFLYSHYGIEFRAHKDAVWFLVASAPLVVGFARRLLWLVYSARSTVVWNATFTGVAGRLVWVGVLMVLLLTTPHKFIELTSVAIGLFSFAMYSNPYALRLTGDGLENSTFLSSVSKSLDGARIDTWQVQRTSKGKYSTVRYMTNVVGLRWSKSSFEITDTTHTAVAAECLRWLHQETNLPLGEKATQLIASTR